MEEEEFEKRMQEAAKTQMIELALEKAKLVMAQAEQDGVLIEMLDTWSKDRTESYSAAVIERHMLLNEDED